MFWLKLNFKIYKLLTLIKLKLMYGKKFRHKRINIRNGFRVLIDGGIVEIGSMCFFNYNCSINCISKIQIGENSIFGENVKIYDHTHIYNMKDEFVSKTPLKKGNIVIGNNVWIGSNVVILPNTVIGDNTVIGANTVIKGIIPPNSIIKRKNVNSCEEIIYKGSFQDKY